MSDYTEVFFSCFDRSFNVPSILADFSIFGFDITIHWYGAIIAFGFTLAVLFGGRIAYTWHMSIDKMLDVLIYGTFAGIAGARLYYVFSKWDYYGSHLSEIPKIWNGGLAIYGGLIGGIIAAFFVCRARKLSFTNLLDDCTMSFLLAQGIGRWGNFANQEAFGVNTGLPWGMWSEKTASYISSNQVAFAAEGISADPSLPVHPTFLYESVWCILGFVIMYFICRKARLFSGQMALIYGVWYGAERAFVEGLRTDSLYIANTNLRVSQVLSLFLAAVCLVFLVIFLIKYKKNPKPIDGVDYYLDDKGERHPWTSWKDVREKARAAAAAASGTDAEEKSPTE